MVLGAHEALWGALGRPWGGLGVLLVGLLGSLGGLWGSLGVAKQNIFVFANETKAPWGVLRGRLRCLGEVLGGLWSLERGLWGAWVVKNTVYSSLRGSLWISGEARGDLFFKVIGCSV